MRTSFFLPAALATCALARGAAAGIPFTVSLYLSQLSLPADLLETATVAILVAAGACGAAGLLILRGIGQRGS